MESGNGSIENQTAGLPDIKTTLDFGKSKKPSAAVGPRATSPVGGYKGPDFVPSEESYLNPKDRAFDRQFIGALGLPDQMYVPSEFKGIAPGKIYDTGYLLNIIYKDGKLPPQLTEESIAKSLYEDERRKSGLGAGGGLSRDKIGELNAKARLIAERISDSLVPLCHFRILYQDGSISKLGGNDETKGLLGSASEGGVNLNFAETAKLFLDTPDFKGDGRGIRALNILFVASGRALPAGTLSREDIATSIKIRTDKQDVIFRDKGTEPVKQMGFDELQNVHTDNVNYPRTKQVLGYFNEQIAKDLGCGIGTVELASALFTTLGSFQRVAGLRNLNIDFKVPGTGEKGLYMLQHEDLDVLGRINISGETGILKRKLSEGGAKAVLEALLETNGPGQEINKAWGGLATLEASAKKFKANLTGTPGGEGSVEDRKKICLKIISPEILRTRVPIINEKTRNYWAALIGQRFVYNEPTVDEIADKESQGNKDALNYARTMRKRKTPSFINLVKNRIKEGF